MTANSRGCLGRPSDIQMVIYASGWRDSWKLAAVKAALVAFGNESEGFPEVPHCLFCPDTPAFEITVIEVNESRLPESWPQVAAQVVEDAMEGRVADCELIGAAPKIIIGAAPTLAEAQAYALMAQTKGLPTIGTLSYSGDEAPGALQDNASYPLYATVATVSTFSTKQMVRFAASTLGAARVNYWYCDDVGGVGARSLAAAKEQALERGVDLVGLKIEPGASSNLSSDVPPGWASLVVAASRTSTHILAEMEDGCFPWDLLNYLHSKSIVGSVGSRWISPMQAVRAEEKYFARRERYPTGSDYASVNALSFFTFLQLQESSEGALRFVSFTQRLVTENLLPFSVPEKGNPNIEANPDFWVAERLREGVYEGTDADGRRQALYIFDAIYAAQLAALKAKEAHGVNFNANQFLDWFKQLDVPNLATGRLALDAKRKRRQMVEIVQYFEDGACPANAQT